MLHVDLFEPANTALLYGRYFLNILSCIKTPVIRFICMLWIFYGDFMEHMLLCMCIIILTVLAIFYDMSNPEILCHCLFYLLFTCTLLQMMNKRCPINVILFHNFLLHWCQFHINESKVRWKGGWCYIVFQIWYIVCLNQRPFFQNILDIFIKDTCGWSWWCSVVCLRELCWGEVLMN